MHSAVFKATAGLSGRFIPLYLFLSNLCPVEQYKHIFITVILGLDCLCDRVSPICYLCILEVIDLTSDDNWNQRWCRILLLNQWTADIELFVFVHLRSRACDDCLHNLFPFQYLTSYLIT